MFIFSAILIAWQTLSSFFHGVALNFIALLTLVFAVLLMIFTDKELLPRIRDLFISACVFCVLEIIIYFACEFGYGEHLLGFIVYQNILSFLGILFLAYVCFRFTAEYLGKQFKFVEFILGNVKHQPKKKEKKAKELSNGSLEDKPKNKINVEKTEEIIEEDDMVIIETEEE